MIIMRSLIKKYRARHGDMRLAQAAFDAEFYRRQRGDLEELNEDACLRHYLTDGWQEGLDPSPDFSTRYYLAANPDLAEDGQNPFLHYLRFGREEGRFPSQLAAGCALIGPEFDAAFYRGQRADLEELNEDACLRHYLTDGWQEGLDPSPEFATRAYLEVYDDVRKLKVNPFLHYVQYGRAEGRVPRPESPHGRAIACLQPHFEPDFYLAQAPDLENFKADNLILHYHIYGWREGRDPARSFSTNFYLRAHPDIRARGLNPFFHYLSEGKAAGRVSAPAAPRVWADLSPAQITHLMTLFDTEYYLSSLPPETAATLPTPEAALAHYVTTGWKDGHDPSSGFATEQYRNAYPDMRGVCPLVHFLLHPHLTPRRPLEDAPLWLNHVPGHVALPQYAFPLPENPPPPRASAAATPPESLDLHWVIPDFAKGGGGHMTIFRMIRQLEGFGHRCTIWIDRPLHHSSGDAAYQDAIRHFQCVTAEIRFLHDGFDRATGDAVIATGWATAYPVQAARGFAQRFYFVQDYEPAFYPTGSERILAEDTYGFDLACICASPWLAEKLAREHGRWTRGFPLAYDPALYAPDAETPPRLTGESARRKIAVYAREHTPRRCVHLAIMALTELGRTRDDFEVHFFGQADLSFQACNFRAFNHGVLGEADLAQLYRECDLALCFSGTNYSLVPQEMMACDLPLIELDGESTRAIFPEGVVTFAGPDPRDIAAKTAHLLDTPEMRADQVARARDWVAQFSWEASARKVEDALYEGIGWASPAPNITRPRDLVMDVVIPTWNGMGEIERVIDALRTQKLAGEVQIHCIDSSSSDGTTEWLRAQPDIALTVIAQSEFQHGRTRNQGAAQGRAPLIGFLTQDAVPAGTNWADDLARMMAHYPQAAGIFGRHLPYPQHSLAVRQEIERHFANLDKQPLALSRDTDPGRWESGDPGWRQVLHFYSDNNSAMRRSIWEQIPYPEIDYGEDQMWAREIIAAGHTKLYAPTAAVWHSHDYGPEETYARAKVEGAFFYTHFGYRLGPASEAALTAQMTRETQRLKAWGRRYRQAPAEVARQVDILHHKLRGWRDGRLDSMAQAKVM